MTEDFRFNRDKLEVTTLSTQKLECSFEIQSKVQNLVQTVVDQSNNLAIRPRSQRGWLNLVSSECFQMKIYEIITFILFLHRTAHSLFWFVHVAQRQQL